MQPKTYIILSEVDRYARADGVLLSGPTKRFVEEHLGHGTEYHPINDFSFIPPLGSNVILAGQRSVYKWLGNGAQLNTERGYVRIVRGCRVVPTYLPIDCTDVVNHEDVGFGGTDDDEADDKNNSKDSAPTARANHRFWFGADVRKLLLGERRVELPELDIKTDWAYWLSRIQDHLVIDIETHPPTNTVQCVGFAGLDTPIISVPCYDHHGRARTELVPFFRTLIRAMQRCVTIGQNIQFDLGFLAHYHGIPWGQRIEDTMIQHHRIYPESEKSLAHLISFWLNAPYHKDTAGTFTPYNEQQYQKLLRYNARDVQTTRAVWLAQREFFAAASPGLRASVRSANRSIEPYLRAGLTGFEYSDDTRRAELRTMARKSEQLTRVFHRLVGYPLLPTSPKQLGEYLYTGMKYPVLERTATGAPSTDAGTLYELAGKFPHNVALRVLLALRDVNKQSDMLDFKPYYRLEKR